MPTAEQPEWAIRMEAKLDLLLQALAGDEQDEGQDLDGNPLPRERQEGDPL